MLKIKDYEVMGLRNAIMGMRNPLNSRYKSDSMERSCLETDVQCSECPCQNSVFGAHMFSIGENDMKLAKSLIKAGSSDRKFLRMIHVQADVLAPLYWWKEYDTYKVGTTTNSCSTMHTIHSKPITLDDFSIDKVVVDDRSICITLKDCFMNVVEDCEMFRQKFIKTKDKRYWKALIQLLPSSFNQMRTIDLDYETILSIYFQRRHHKLDEWHTFCNWIKKLPYMEEFISVLDKKEESNG